MLALVLDRVLPWSKAVDDCEGFREFSFDTHRWFMRRWNLSEPFNALLVRVFELNPYRRIAASSIPRKVKKINYFITTPEGAQLALQRYSDAAAEHQRRQELVFLEGRYGRQAEHAAVFRAASHSPKAAQSGLPGNATLQHVGASSRTEPSDPPLPYPQDTPNAGPLPKDALGLTGITARPVTATTGGVGSPTACPLPADEDERLMQEALIAAHRLKNMETDVATTVFPAARLRSSSFVRRPSPLRSTLSLHSENDEVEGTSGVDNYEAFAFSSFDGIEIGNAPPLVDDDDDDGLNSSGMPSTPRNRLTSIPELQGAASVAESPSPPEPRRDSLPRLRPLTILGGLGMETFHSSAMKPSALAKAIQPHKMRRCSAPYPYEPPPNVPEDAPHVLNRALADFRIESNPADGRVNGKAGTPQHRDAVATVA
jgi:hypothetical protein